VSIGKMFQTLRRIEVPTSPGPSRATVFVLLDSEAKAITIFRNVGKCSIRHNILHYFNLLAVAFDCVVTMTHYAPCEKSSVHSIVDSADPYVRAWTAPTDGEPGPY
jgi:hypothetical protein